MNVRADVILHAEAQEYIGHKLAIVGDIDGDGIDDMLMGRAKVGVDSFYTVYGRTDWSTEGPLDTAPVVELEYEFTSSYDTRIVPAGDVDGDGFDDFLVSDFREVDCTPMDSLISLGTREPEEVFAQHEQLELRGAVYLVYGGPERLTGEQRITDIAAKLYDPTPCTRFGDTIAGLGDIDGDGYDDFAIATSLGTFPMAAAHSLDAMQTYIFYGGANRLTGTISAPAEATAAVRTYSPDAYLDLASSAGDLNGDGYDDFFIGQNQIGPRTDDSPRFHVVFGSPNRIVGELDIVNVATSAGVQGFQGNLVRRGHLGQGRPVGIGDINNDGLDDFVVTLDSEDRADAIFYGRSEGFSTSITPDQAIGQLVHQGNHHFSVILGPGDVDGDGNSDLMIGDPTYNGDGGAGFLVHGTDTHFAGSVALEDQSTIFFGSKGIVIHEEDGVVFEWPDRDQAGRSISKGDINGDGIADFAIDATGGFDSAVYLLLSPFTGL